MQADVGALTLTWVLAAAVVHRTEWLQDQSPWTLLWAAAIAITGTLAAIYGQRLYRARTCAIRSLEIERLGRAVLLSSAALVLAAERGWYHLPIQVITLSGALAFAFLCTGRLAFRSWVSQQRRLGHYVRPLLLVGGNREAADLARIVAEHPEMGLHLVGAVTSSGRMEATDLPILGTHDEVVDACRRSGATGVLLVASAIDPDELSSTTRELLDSGLHVHLSSGLRGISSNRLLPLPMAHEPLFYVEQNALRVWQVFLKRALDVLIAAMLIVLLLPIFALTAALVKAEDGGPLLFRQERVGLRGRLFPCFKFRTMVVDADAQLANLMAQNQRSGPLFKMANDPRVTRIGRVLRATSIDEIPQLFNVLLGHMSLVGPRPALPREMAEFDERLRSRVDVLPGITGLWQVEARDNEAFGPYRRLDLFYLDNWSVGLDLSILVSTAAVVSWRGMTALMGFLPHSVAKGRRVADVLD